MVSCQKSWKNMGRIVTPGQGIPWLIKYAGAACAVQSRGNNQQYDLLITGRDCRNRSRIGKAILDLTTLNVTYDYDANSVIDLGEVGAFDENGTAYPWLVQVGSERLLYYVGWMPTKIAPFQNHIGLAKMTSNLQFQRISRAPILERTDDEPYSTGSCCVLHENNMFKMWYTSFLGWRKKQNRYEPKYLIKYAESANGINWRRDGLCCIDFEDSTEFAICRPSIIYSNEKYHMWYCVRGETYHLGYAFSDDGIQWNRRDDLLKFQKSGDKWDSKSCCYPFVFNHENHLYMLYSGNNYGQGGLGLAKLE